jgi:hypothetical protein
MTGSCDGDPSASHKAIRSFYVFWVWVAYSKRCFDLQAYHVNHVMQVSDFPLVGGSLIHHFGKVEYDTRDQWVVELSEANGRLSCVPCRYEPGPPVAVPGQAPGEAHDLLAPVYEWFTEGSDTADLQEAKALLEELT